MSNGIKNGELRAIIDGVLTQIMIETTAEQVKLTNDISVATKIVEMIAAINLRAKIEDVNSQIESLRKEMLGDVPVEAYNTFTELASYISEHKEISDALTTAIGNKVNQNDFDELSKIISESNHAHSNKNVLDNVTSDWDGKTTLYVTEKKPEDLTSDDFWFEII